MKRLAVFLFIAALLLALNVWAADQKAVDFKGVYILDAARSDAAPKGGGGGMGGFGGGMGGFGGMGGGMGGMGGGGGMGGFGGGMRMQVQSLELIQTETEMSITTKFQNSQQSITEGPFKLDGSVKKELTTQNGMFGQPATQGKKETKLKLSGSKFEIVEKTKYPQSTSTLKRTYTISGDGKVLTVKVNNSTNGTTQKLVLNKQQ
jgi:hypothetical protein